MYRVFRVVNYRMPELTYPVESVAIETLKAHPKNYKKHPIKQLEHLMKSIEEHGFYRNVIIAKDSTILAGHGVVQAWGNRRSL